MPALKPKPFGANEKLVKIEEMPTWMHPAFEGMKSLNRIQSRVCPASRYTLGPHAVSGLLIFFYALALSVKQLTIFQQAMSSGSFKSGDRLMLAARLLSMLF